MPLAPDQPVSGTADPRFAAVSDALREQLSSGEELGASLVVDVDGRTVVDLWGGWQDPERRTPWTEDTIVNLWSSTKTVTNLAALVLVDRGLLDPYARVAEYWPEFAAAGKDAVEVRHVLGHTSGVSAWEAPFAVEDLFDRETATRRLADQAPWWPPGTASGYHAATQGFLVGELVRRVTGRSLTAFVADELAGPLGADFRIGAADADAERIATIVPSPPQAVDLDALDHDGPMYKTFTAPPTVQADANRPAWRRAELGGLNGHGNARSVGRILRAVALGGAAGRVRLLSPATIEIIFDEQSHGTDLVLGIPLRFGIGFGLPEEETMPYLGQGRVCFWGGWGGSLVVCDLDRRMTITYAMNKMAPGIIGSDRSEAYVRAVYGCLSA